MKIPWPRNRDVSFDLVLLVAFLVGLGLRVYLLGDQVLVNDEWHGLYYVIGKSPGWLLTHFSIPGATCIPLNLYAWLLLVTSGWSETMLRLPSLVFGLLGVVVGPLLARGIVGPRRAALLALLLAISPLQVFYSRIFRPYSAVALLAFAAILLAARWMQSGGLRSALLYAGTGALAVYFHLFAVVTVAAPVLAALVFHAWMRRPGAAGPAVAGPPLRQWLAASAVMGGASALLVLPALIGSIHGTFFSVALVGKFNRHSILQAALLISGTRQPVLALPFWGALILGAIEQCRRNPWFGGMLVSLYPLHALALIASRPISADDPVVLTRYCIPLVPVSLLFVACGMQAVIEAIAARVNFRPVLQIFTTFACVAALAIAGPLPQCYLPPNNFTNHNAYQHQSESIDWQSSYNSDFTRGRYRIHPGEISPFYRRLADHPNSRPIVEYPMFIGDDFNPLYYYQYFHRRPVLVGYTTNMLSLGDLGAGNVFGNTYIDEVLSLVPDPAKLQFRNLVSMGDLGAMRVRGAEYVILHKHFEGHLYEIAPPPPGLDQLRDEYQKALGDPVYEDMHIVVFSL
jgi:hypothetical protein